MAKPIVTHPQRQEYRVHVKEQTSLGQQFSTLDFLNELGQDGWIIINVRESMAASGMVTDSGKPIPKMVLEVLARRAMVEVTARAEDAA